MTLIRATRYAVLLSLLLGFAAQSQTAERGRIIVLIGPTGSRKSTQAEFLKERFGVPIFAGDELIQANPAALAKFSGGIVTPAFTGAAISVGFGSALFRAAGFVLVWGMLSPSERLSSAPSMQDKSCIFPSERLACH